MNIVKIIVQPLLWLATLVFVGIWIADCSINAEPYTVLFGIISAAFSSVISWQSNKIKKEKFSVANALAYGYVNNFIEPIMTQLIKKNRTDEIPFMYICMPDKITDVLPKSIDRITAQLKERNLESKTIKITLEEGRGLRDVLTVRSIDGKNVYLDFPNTLLTLQSVINFKVNSPKNSFGKIEAEELSKEYISAFKETVTQLLTEKGLYKSYVAFTDNNLELGL